MDEGASVECSFFSFEPIIRSYKLIFAVLYLVRSVGCEKFTICVDDEYKEPLLARTLPNAVRSLTSMQLKMLFGEWIADVGV